MSSFVARLVLRSRAPLPRPPLRRTLATAATTSTSDSNTPPVSDPSPDTVTSTDADASINLDDLESVLPDFKLPPEKLRHLIALFHEAGSFVTRETLDERILDAFIRAPETSTTTLGPYQTYQTLRYRNARRKNEPETAFQPEYLDEDGKVREKRVFETLYGTGRGYLPGLELMLESWNAIESRLTNDESERQGMVVEGSGREKGISSVVANLGKKSQRSPWSTETR